VFHISPFIKAQADSIALLGHELEFYRVIGKGAFGYLRNVIPLGNLLKRGNFDVVHAHYSLCGFTAALAMTLTGLRKLSPLVCSLMGSDVMGGGVWRKFLRYMVDKMWDITIVKSLDMKHSIGVGSLKVIPNGVDIARFKPLSGPDSRRKIGWQIEGKHILFGANPAKPVKNFTLAKQAHAMMNSVGANLTTLGRVAHEDVPYYLNACDVLLLTSQWEGSPNIVKEAMACGTPVVTTDVGDLRWLLDGVEGCYLTAQEPGDIATRLELALQFKGKTQGRSRLIELGLDSETVARQIMEVYLEAHEMKKKSRAGYR